jgi:L-threonylcarbamoyladenylate synthase
MSYFTNWIDDQVVELLKSGKVGLLPSDTIYGLSAIALNENAVKKVHRLKDRSGHKPFIVLISDTPQLEVLGIESTQAKIVKNYWPGALSVIFASKTIPSWLQLGSRSLAIRMPANQKLCDLIAKTGPIISTSANLEGEKPANSAKEAQEVFGEQLDFYVDIGKLEGEPSTLVAIENEKLKVVRQGSLKIKP